MTRDGKTFLRYAASVCEFAMTLIKERRRMLTVSIYKYAYINNIYIYIYIYIYIGTHHGFKIVKFNHDTN